MWHHIHDRVRAERAPAAPAAPAAPPHTLVAATHRFRSPLAGARLDVLRSLRSILSTCDPVSCADVGCSHFPRSLRAGQSLLCAGEYSLHCMHVVSKRASHESQVGHRRGARRGGAPRGGGAHEGGEATEEFISVRKPALQIVKKCLVHLIQSGKASYTIFYITWCQQLSYTPYTYNIKCVVYIL